MRRLTTRSSQQLTLPLFLPMRTEILLSLLSLSSFLCRSFSASFATRASSFALFASLFSLSECKLLLELEPFSNDNPNTDDFRCVELGVVCTCSFSFSLGGDLLGGRRWEEMWWCVGEIDEFVAEACTDCEDDRRKKGMEEGVKRLVEGPRRIEEDGLSGVCWGTGGSDAVRFVLPLDAVSGRLGER